MATLLTAAPTTAKTLTCTNVIDPKAWYSLGEIEDLLGIPTSAMYHTILNWGKGYQSRGDLNTHGSLSGESLLRMIAGDNIQYEISELAKKGWDRKHRPLIVSPPEPEAQGLVNQVEEQLAARRDLKAEEETAENEHMALIVLRGIYRAIAETDDDVSKSAKIALGKFSIKATQEDVRDLTFAMSTNGMTPDQFGIDVEKVRNVLLQVLRHDDLTASGKAVVAAREDLKKFRKSAEDRERELERAHSAANTRSRAALKAAYELTKLHRVLPETWFVSGSPPRPRKLVG